MKRIAWIMLLATVTLLGCKSEKEPKATEPSQQEAPAEAPGGDDETHSEGDHGGEVHLGEHMYELSRRFAATWFAGKAGNAAMVEYQLHEMHEVIEELEKKQPTEAGVDVVKRLESDVESHFETLEKAVEDGDQKKFESTYRTVMGNCTTCHADTKHPFIQVKIPEYNPYPNLTF